LQESQPIPGAMVSMSTQERESSVFMRGFDVATDASGRFTLMNIPAETQFHLYTQMKDVRGLGVTLPMQSVTTGPDRSKVELGDLATKAAFTVMGRVVLSDGKPIPPKTKIYLGLDDAYDSQDMTLGPEGAFEFGGIPAARIDMSVRITGYRVSAKNPNKDWLNDGRLVGRLEGNIEDFVIHLEPGQRVQPNELPNDAERQPRDKPLRGATL